MNQTFLFCFLRAIYPNIILKDKGKRVNTIKCLARRAKWQGEMVILAPKNMKMGDDFIGLMGEVYSIISKMVMGY